MTTLKTLALAAVAAATLGACAPAASSEMMKSSFGPEQAARGGASASAGARGQGAVIEVENRNWSDMVVYVVQGTMRMRLGTVTSMQTQTFRLPRIFQGNGGEIQLLADPIGSPERYLSEPIRLNSGEQVSLSVSNSIRLSNLAVYRR